MDGRFLGHGGHGFDEDSTHGGAPWSYWRWLGEAQEEAHTLACEALWRCFGDLDDVTLWCSPCSLWWSPCWAKDLMNPFEKMELMLLMPWWSSYCTHYPWRSPWTYCLKRFFCERGCLDVAKQFVAQKAPSSFGRDNKRKHYYPTHKWHGMLITSQPNFY